MKKVVLIEDYEIVLRSYTEIINNTEDFEVVGAYISCEDAFKEIELLNPDFVLIDITLPGMSGIEGIKHIKHKLPDTSIIVVSVHENSKYVFDALCAGAVGYLTKSSGQEKLLQALYQAKDGGAPMSINIARMVVESFQEKKFDELTERENKVLILLAEGKSYANIGEDLNVSHNTIKYHVRNIYEKLHVTSKAEAIKLLKKKS
ncbi:response regulator transcription factor [Aquimarina sp. 2201CG5-10]|uniref:response regulator transcription factor n=1 Tax=Aquimarina callyspongiae TaxID=3098150 RepID=UPI002AB4ABC4|nr:response regulator transcription factor [Aquimarina sp. 2201CG5-10]MDY8135156.1 response regulator transcription factor [Aquimarina sp. 2201CG5-10]